MKQRYTLVLYYCYTTVQDPEAFREEHHRYCLQQGLRGRIIIAPEGINGTVSGLPEACERYMQQLQADERFATTHFKVTPHTEHAFQKLHVRVKPEIVHVGLPDINPAGQTAGYIPPAALQQMRAEPGVVLVDMRSTYEHNIGKFKNAVTLNIHHCREFPSQIDTLLPYKENKIVLYCTGGVRCEKARLYLGQKGFPHVYQLHGGIIQYGFDTAGEDFEGKCYVFDNRIAIPINKQSPTVISTCYVCSQACDRMVNCANPTCNRHVPLCSPCGETLQGACSTACQQHPQKRTYGGTGYYTTQLNGYNPYKGLVRNP